MRELAEIKAHLKAGRHVKFEEKDRKDVLSKIWMLTEDDDKQVARNAMKEFARYATEDIGLFDNGLNHDAI